MLVDLRDDGRRKHEAEFHELVGPPAPARKRVREIDHAERADHTDDSDTCSTGEWLKRHELKRHCQSGSSAPADWRVEVLVSLPDRASV